MSEEPRRPGLPGGALPPSIARARPPESNGNIAPTDPEPSPHPPLTRGRAAWEDLDADDLERSAAAPQRTEFRRLLEMTPERAVRTGSTPSLAVWIGIALVVAVVILAIVLYRLAPP